MFIYETKDRIWLGSSVSLVSEDREMAWAERSFRQHPAHKHFLGSYVEADRANTNRQCWSLDDLRGNLGTIIGSPVDWAHNPRRCIGYYADAELMYPTDSAEDEDKMPFIETLGVLWPYNFPEEMARLEQAHSAGTLAQSMECVAKTVTCAGPSGCKSEFAYKGPKDSSYCSCLNDGPGWRQLNNPTFLGGGLLVPPVAPGWRNAKIADLSSLMKDHADEADRLREGIEAEFANLGTSEWDALMGLVLSVARNG